MHPILGILKFKTPRESLYPKEQSFNASFFATSGFGVLFNKVYKQRFFFWSQNARISFTRSTDCGKGGKKEKNFIHKLMRDVVTRKSAGAHVTRESDYSTTSPSR